MTSDRGRIQALHRLVDLQTPGAFTLPQELLTAADLPTKVSSLALPEIPDHSIESAADDVLRDLRAGQAPNLDGYAQRLADISSARQRYDVARTIVANAREHAQSMAVNTAADLADKVVTDVLRPVFEALLSEAADHAKTLDGHPLDDRSLVTAPAKVRSSWGKLRDLAEQYAALREARARACTAGLRIAQRDAANEFLIVQCPQVLTGHEPGTGRAPRLDGLTSPTDRYPEDPVQLMLWCVGPGKRAGIWLPTVAEQDAAWQGVYGEQQQQRVNAAARARGLVAT